MKLKELKAMAVKLIDEYSNDSNITDDEDIRLKLNDLFNIAQFELCQLKKIEKTFSVVQNIAENRISPVNNPDEFYTHNSEELVFTGEGTSYHFQIKGKGNIIIKQNGMDDILIINEDNESFKTYKGLTSGSGTISIIFGGTSFYTIKNVAIFNINFEDINEIPNYERYIVYKLPEDYYQINFLESKGARIKDYVVRGKNLRISSYCIGEFIVNYYAYPTVINDETPDDFELELDLEAQMILPYYVASDILKSDVSANYTSFEAKYNAKLEILNSTVEENPMEIVQILGNL